MGALGCISLPLCYRECGVKIAVVKFCMVGLSEKCMTDCMIESANYKCIHIEVTVANSNL